MGAYDRQAMVFFDADIDTSFVVISEEAPKPIANRHVLDLIRF